MEQIHHFCTDADLCRKYPRHRLRLSSGPFTSEELTSFVEALEDLSDDFESLEETYQGFVALF